MKANYSTSPKPPSPPVERISGGFKPGSNPAATFGQGARLGDMSAIEKSAEAVRQRSRELSRGPARPMNPIGE
jgi:hypothetical protein